MRLRCFRSLSSFLPCLAAVVFAAASARAQPAGTSAESAQAARQREGMSHFERSEFEAARLAFLQAYAAKPEPKILWNLALAEYKGGRHADALAHFRRYLASSAATDKQRAAAQPMMTEAKGHVGELRIEAPSGSVITLDGARLDEEVVFVLPGEHAIAGRFGERTDGTTLAVVAGEARTVRLAKLTGVASVTAPPVVTAPSPPREAEAASSPAATEPPPAADAPSGHGARNLVVTGLGIVGLAGLATGIGLALTSNGQLDDATAFDRNIAGGACARRASASCDAYAAKLDDVTSTRSVATGFLVGGGVLTAASAVLFFAWPSSSGARAGVRPVLTLTSAGAGLAGFF
jgi:hypothetical protein